MNIAAQRHRAGDVEPDRAFLLAAIEFQLEPVAAGEGLNVVADPVAIGEDHIGAARHDQDERVELDVDLGHFQRLGPERDGRQLTG